MIHCGRLLPEGLSARLATPLTNAPYICWAHGEELGYINRSRELAWLMARVHDRAAAVIANSANTALMLARTGVLESKVKIVHPGVDHTRFHPDLDVAAIRRRYAPRGELLILSVGRLQARKGHDVAIQAIARLQRQNCHYLIVGDGDELPRLKQLAQDAGVSSLVTFEPRITSQILPSYYAAADIFVHPNRTEGDDFEGFGLVFLEAAASGLPAIGGRSGGVPEAIAENETGLLVGGVDPDELAAALRHSLTRPICVHEWVQQPVPVCQIGSPGKGPRRPSATYISPCRHGDSFDISRDGPHNRRSDDVGHDQRQPLPGLDRHSNWVRWS